MHFQLAKIRWGGSSSFKFNFYLRFYAKYGTSVLHSYLVKFPIFCYIWWKPLVIKLAEDQLTGSDPNISCYIHMYISCLLKVFNLARYLANTFDEWKEHFPKRSQLKSRIKKNSEMSQYLPHCCLISPKCMFLMQIYIHWGAFSYSPFPGHVTI